jgi:uncharacterized membrane protein
MKLKLINKNNIGIITTLILIVALSQSRVFNFLIETTLGRSILILIILGISCVHKMFGVIVILFIIIIFNHYTANFSNIHLMENFSNYSNQMAVETTSVASGVAKSVGGGGGGREGFNIIDRESSILKGKRSNEVPVFSNARNQTEEVEPSEKATFSSEHSTV